VSTDSSDNTLDSFIREWDSKLVAYIRKDVPTAEIATDIAQGVWLVVYEQEGDGLVPDNLAKRLFGIARHKVADWHRANTARQSVPLTSLLAEIVETPSRESGPGEALRELPEHMQDAFYELGKILPRLTQRERDAVIFRHYVGMPVDEVAAAMGVKQNAAKRFMAKGLRKIRTLLSQAGYTISVSTREMP
jgi:RNA polymerase sigma factor (sigma-70 family)